jgi:hypothetical protein
MSSSSSEFLPSVIGILQELHATSSERGQTMLAFLLDLARTEAEDELRQAGLEAGIKSTLRETSTVGAWH